MRMPLIAAVVMLAVLLTPSAAYTFKGDAVSYKGTPVNFCPSASGQAKDCDASAAASLFCRSVGYVSATKFSGPVPADSTVALQVMADGKPRLIWTTTAAMIEGCQSNDGKACSTFSSIECVGARTYANPVIDGKPLDWCMTTADGTKACGKDAANGWCVRTSSFRGVVAVSGPVRTALDTVQLDGSGRDAKPACNGKGGGCQAFQNITCGFD